MKRSYWRRLMTAVLCMVLLMNTVAMPYAMAASAKTIKQSKATFSCVTMNDKVKWLFGRTSTVTITNHSKDPLKVYIKDVKGCTVYTYEALILKDNSVTIQIKTSFGKCGSFKINFSNALGGPIEYSLSSSGVQSIVRTK